MKTYSKLIIESSKYEEYINDYKESDSVSGNEKKALAEKYHTSPKIKDIQKAILFKMRDERHTRTEFRDEDITNFSRLDFPERDFEKYLAEEPIEFVRFYADHYLQMLKKKHLDRLIGQKLNGYNTSISDRYHIKRYTTILNYLTVNDKSAEEKAKDKADKERAEMMKQNLIGKLQEQLVDFKNRIINLAKAQAKKTYEAAPSIIEKHTNAIKKIESSIEGKSYFSTRKEYAEIQEHKKAMSKYKMILVKFKSLDEYVTYCEEEAIKEFDHNVEAIAERVREKGLEIEKIECTHVTDDPKFIEMMISDGSRKLYCRSIIAAEYSEKVSVHFRFIITERK